MRQYKYDDGDGRGLYRHHDVAAPGNGGYFYELDAGEKMPAKGYRMPKGRALEMLADGILILRAGRVPVRKRYLSDSKGVQLGPVWTNEDMPNLQASAKEKVGYPTQKPLALYKRIIRASSNEGDIVLDPFCGCATTLVAAEALKRRWIGIDLWEGAATTLQGRIWFPVHARREPPVRTDDEANVGAHLPSINRRRRKAEPWMRLSHADMRDILYAAQGGVCAGCGRELHIRFMQLDHMQPRDAVFALQRR